MVTGGGFKKRGVTEVGIKRGFVPVNRVLNTSELPGLSLRLPASQLESRVERGREVFQLTLGPRAALAAAKDKGDECNEIIQFAVRRIYGLSLRQHSCSYPLDIWA